MTMIDGRMFEDISKGLPSYLRGNYVLRGGENPALIDRILAHEEGRASAFHRRRARARMAMSRDATMPKAWRDEALNASARDAEMAVAASAEGRRLKRGLSKSIRTPYGIVRTRVMHGAVRPRVDARLKGQNVGSLELRQPKGGKRTVAMIGVDASLRRRGIGREMYRAAERVGLQPKHSETLMPLGERYVRGMGTRRVGLFRVPRVGRSAERKYRKYTKGLPEAKDELARARFTKPLDRQKLSDIEYETGRRAEGLYLARRADQASEREGGVIRRFRNRVRSNRNYKPLITAQDEWYGLSNEAGGGVQRAGYGRVEGDSVYWRNRRSVTKAMVPPTAVRRIATHVRRYPKSYGAGAAATAGLGIYGAGSLQGTNLRASARGEFANQMDTYQRMLDERSKDKSYKHVGNQVYVRNRRFFQDSTRPSIEQLVRENKSGAPIYTNIGYSLPWSSAAATTYPHDVQRATSMTLRPGARNTGANRLASRFYATHEHQHVKDYSGQGKQRRMMENALTYAYRKHPSQGAVKDFVTGRGLRRTSAFQSRMGMDVGYGEGRADAAAGRRLRVDPRGISGYPDIAQMDAQFAEGYRRGGGKTLPTDTYEAMRVSAQARQEFKRRARQHKQRKH